jgi:hypothetical protein
MMDDITRQREVDISWSRHEPERDRVPAEVWRRVRAFKRDLAPTAAIIERVLKNEHLAQPLITKCVRRRGMARQQFLGFLRRTLPNANVLIRYKEILEVSWLSPRPPMFAETQHPGELQDCILVCFLAAWPVLGETNDRQETRARRALSLLYSFFRSDGGPTLGGSPFRSSLN